MKSARFCQTQRLFQRGRRVFSATKVINALGGLIADAINEETAASEKRMSKYLKSKPKVEVVRNDRGTADNS